MAERGDLQSADHRPPVSPESRDLVDRRIASNPDLHPSQPARVAILKLEASGGLTAEVDRGAVAAGRPLASPQPLVMPVRHQGRAAGRRSMEVACHAKVQRLFTTCLMSKHQQIDLRSLAMDQSTAQRLLANPALVERALATLDRWLKTCSPRVRPVLMEWQALLQQPLPEVISVLLSTDPRATRLRQSSPFAGLLTVSERTDILKRFSTRDSQSA